MIVFNKPHLTGKELAYIEQALKEQTSGNGQFTKKCQDFFHQKYNFRKALLTTSCTDALEMAALLLNIGPEDEVIIPSFTFVSTANAFVLRGAKIVFADSLRENPNIDVSTLESLITKKTKAIVVVHYAGVAVDMDPLIEIANKFNLFIVEDAAQAIDAYYKSKPLGGIGHLGCFSFHETKNIISGEGGMLVINDERFMDRAEILWEKGTNRSAFIRGEVDKYSWVDVGSSFLPSEITAAFLYAQLKDLDYIQKKRMLVWNYYQKNLASVLSLAIPQIPTFSIHNGHIFYVLADDKKHRDYLIQSFRNAKIDVHFHYPPLHLSQFYKRHRSNELTHAVNFSERIVRLPLYPDLEKKDQDRIIDVLTAAMLPRHR